MTLSVRFLNTNNISYEFKQVLFKLINDNVNMQIANNAIGHHHEVENLYLLISLSLIGKEYWLPESTLINYFSIKINKNGEYYRDNFLNLFSITILLSYIKTKKRYKKLRLFIETHILDKFNSMKPYGTSDAECLILMFDLVICPYISDLTKKKIAVHFNLDSLALIDLQNSHDQWFTAWGDKFNISKELDAKRSREVY